MNNNETKMKNKFKQWFIKFFSLESDQIKSTEPKIVLQYKTAEPLRFTFERELPKSFSIMEATDKAKKELIQSLLQESSVFNIYVEQGNNSNYNKLRVELMAYKYE